MVTLSQPRPMCVCVTNQCTPSTPRKKEVYLIQLHPWEFGCASVSIVSSKRHGCPVPSSGTQATRFQLVYYLPPRLRRPPTWARSCSNLYNCHTAKGIRSLREALTHRCQSCDASSRLSITVCQLQEDLKAQQDIIYFLELAVADLWRAHYLLSH